MTSNFSQLKDHAKVQQAKQDFYEFVDSLKQGLNRQLFEASSDFWAYHLGGMSALVAMDLLLSLFLRPSSIWGFHLISLVVWIASFTVAGLLYRRHYKLANWDALPQVVVLIKSIGCAIFFAVPIVFMLTALSIVFLDDFQRFFQIYEFAGRNLFMTSFYLLCWMILYMGITSRRQAKEIEVANLRLQNSLREAELSSLSNQLNPHFLFNALNNIRFMILEDAKNAETMLMSLSQVLRYSLESSKRDKVDFEQELQICQRYIDLVQIQFEERLRFSIDVPSNLMSCTLPPMVLQMLLENSVKHGIENIASGGEIQMSADLLDQRLVLTVCNDLPDDYKESSGEPGIGLLNIEQRLDLLYGEQARLVAGAEDGRYCVTLTIPQVKTKDSSEPSS